MRIFRKSLLVFFSLYIALLPVSLLLENAQFTKTRIVQPVSAVEPSPTTVKYLYDGDGNRVAVINGTKITLYNGDFEKDLSTNETTKYYGIAGKRAAIESNNTIRYVIVDQLDSVRVAVSDTGEKRGESSYFPYGKVRNQVGVMPTKQYTGQTNEDLTGLYFYKARYYNSNTGNFVQADSIGSGLNKYNYVNGNPINFTDPTGNEGEVIDFASPGSVFPETGISSGQASNTTTTLPDFCLSDDFSGNCSTENRQALIQQQDKVFASFFVATVGITTMVVLIPVVFPALVAAPEAVASSGGGVAAAEKIIRSSNEYEYVLKTYLDKFANYYEVIDPKTKQVVANAQVWIDDAAERSAGTLSNIYTEVAYRQQGIATQMLKTMQSDFSQIKLTDITPTTIGMDAASRVLQNYLRLGFQQISQDPETFANTLKWVR